MEANDEQFEEVRQWATTIAQQFENSFVCNDRSQEKSLPLFEPTELLQGSRQPCGEYFDAIELKGVLLNQLPTHRRIAEKTKQQSLRARFAERASVGSYSIKVIRSDAMATVKQHRDAAAAMVIETKFLIHLSHVNVIKLYGMTVEGMASLSRPGKQGFFTILESVQETLEQRIDRWMIGGCDDSDNMTRRLEVGEDLSSALVYLSNRKIIFGAVRPDNIGFDANYGRLKLMNFGNAREESQVHFVNSEEEHKNMKILPYTAPEVLRKEKVTRKSDVYSFGIILWTLLSIDRPFEGVDASKYIQDAVDGDARPPMQDSWPKAACDLIRSCWKHDPKERPNIANVQQGLEGALVGQFSPEEDPIWKKTPTPPTSIDSSSADLDELASICQRSVSAASRHSTFSSSMNMSMSDDNSFCTFWLQDPNPPSLLSPPGAPNSLSMHLSRSKLEASTVKLPSSRRSVSSSGKDKFKSPLLMPKTENSAKDKSNVGALNRSTGSIMSLEQSETATHASKSKGSVSGKIGPPQPKLLEALGQLDERASICKRSLSVSRHSRISVSRDRSPSASRSRSPSASRRSRGRSTSRHARGLSISRHSAFSSSFSDLDSSDSSIDVKEPKRNSSALFASHSSQMNILESLVGMAADEKVDSDGRDTCNKTTIRHQSNANTTDNAGELGLDNNLSNLPATKSTKQKKHRDRSEFGSPPRSRAPEESEKKGQVKKTGRNSNDGNGGRLGFPSRRSNFSPRASNQPTTIGLSARP